MTALDQPRTTYTETLLHKRVIANRVLLIDPIETPFLDFIGMDSAKSKFKITENGKAIEWVLDQYRQLTGTLAATATSTATGFTVSDASVFKVGDVVLMPDGAEKAWISAVDTSGDSVTMTRAFDGSTAATQATGSITILSEAQLENRESWTAGNQESMSTTNNYIQTFEDTVKLTDVEDKIARYAIDDMFGYQVDKKMPELYRAMERAIFRQTTGSAGSATTPSYMKGLKGFITTNTFSTTRAAMTYGNIQTLVLNMYNNGANPDTVWCNPDWLNYVTNLYNSSQYLRVERSENAVGMNVKRLVTSFGEWELRTDRWISTADVFFLDSNMVGLHEFDPFHQEDVPRSGPWQRRAVTGIYSIAVGAEKGHGRLTFTA